MAFARRLPRTRAFHLVAARGAGSSLHPSSGPVRGKHLLADAKTFRLHSAQTSFHSAPYAEEVRSLDGFSQKQTSWVFNDQPRECADVGHSRKIGRAAKMGWEKIGYPAIVAGRDCRSGAADPILSTQRIPRGRDPVFIYTKNRCGQS